MTKQSSTFCKLDGVNGIYIVQSGKLRCTAFQSSQNTLCLYSPVPKLGAIAHRSLLDLGHVSLLIAPNHYHNRGLAENVRYFPDADLVCSPAASPRLSKVTDLVFQDLSILTDALPSHIRILQPEGLKTGEIWLQIDDGNEVVWIVTDAFSSTSARPGEGSVVPTMLGTFPNYGIQNGTVYKSWVERQIAKKSPTILVPCHGAPVRSPDLGLSLTSLINDYF